jgi:putative membrane protein
MIGSVSPMVAGAALALTIGVSGLAPGSALAQASGAEDLTDAEIAHIAVTANAIDAELGELARERATNEAVVGFAERMIAEHTAVNEQAAVLAGRLDLTPRNNAVSRALREEAAATRAELERLRGASFDRAYMEHEIAYHGAVLEALDDVLIPGATNAELRSLLETVRPVVAAHLEHARQIRDSLRRSPYGG